MKHPKWLLILIIALLAINIIFYALWYALDGKGKIEKMLETELSKVLKGEFSINRLSVK
ncbi:MAG: hypothetical protein MZV63_15010 [Marinilabiliales bacterium]|nr:hypothetical protein [Marinilabiliales bacterium]